MNDTPTIILRPLNRPVDKTVRLPGSKSLTNRALITAALARGESELSGILLADDTRHMIRCLQTLGVPVFVDEMKHAAWITGCGGYFPESEAGLYAGNAGTVMRFLTAVCAAARGEYLLDGDPRMRQRPIRQLVDALRDLGAQIAYSENEGYCPLAIHARGLRGGQVVFDRPVSSQFVSAILLAAPLAGDDVLIDVSRGLPSAPYVKMTIAVMDAFSVPVVEERMERFIVPAPQGYQPTTYVVEPDASAASYFFAAAAITGGRVTVEGLGTYSVQGDWKFVRLLERMGCRVEHDARSTTVHGAAGGRLNGIDVDLVDMPDVAPTLAVLAAFAEGPTRIRNVANLRVKESDRLAALATELGHIGVESEVFEDGLLIRPVRTPVAGIIDTYDDHRIAMSFALAGLRIDGVVIRDPDCVAKTFPGFFDLWSELDS